MTISTVSNSQHEILESILHLFGRESFDADLTYGNGGFYGRGIAPPCHRLDVDTSLSGLTRIAPSDNTGLPENSLESVVFDPPFLTYVKGARGHGSVMAARFGGYWRYDELEAHYTSTLRESARILRHKGIMVFKCQDIIHNHRLHPTHINVVQWAEPWFRLQDIYVLTAKSRMPIPPTKGHAPKRQRHARIFHSYFLVLKRWRK